MGGQPGGNSGAFRGTPPGLALADLLGQAAGPGKRYASVDDDGVVVAAGRWDAIESWAAAQKLAAIREMIRRRPLAGSGAAAVGEMPGVWRKDLTEEIALELGITKNAAAGLIGLAWTLEVRLPLTAAALDDGTLNLSKARMLADETSVLSDEDAGEAEKLVAGKWKGKTWSQIRVLTARAVVNVDPEGAARRREKAEQEDARVRFWREHTGTAGLAGYGLPTDQALKAHQNIQHRARAYKKWGIPEPMDLLRVMAMLDLLNGADARNRYPKAPAGNKGAQDAQDGRPEDDARHAPHGGRLDDEDSDDDLDNGDDPDEGGPGDHGPDDGGPGDSGGPDGNVGDDDGLPANIDLTIPLLDLLGLAQRAGEAHGLGVLDPGLARKLAAEAANNPRSVFRVIVTDGKGQAVGFGRAALTRRKRKPGADKPPRPEQGEPGKPGDGTATPPAAFTPAGRGPADGYGTWFLGIGEHQFTVKLHSIPTEECDHRYESAGYQPSETLRRLVQIRDGECTMTVCVRHPKGCDWEHAIPWPAGRTCSCNGGCHCRRDHLIKQSKDWKVEQSSAGRRWTTPSSLTYIKGPREYPI